MGKEKHVEVSMTAYSARGEGVGTLSQKGKEVRVTGAVVGDRLEVLLGRRMKRVNYGTLNRILSPSPDRIEPRCTHSGTCGGCSWQQVAYQAQVEQKERIVRDLFSPLLKDCVLHPMIPCASPWEYRNKMEFSFSQDKEGKRFLGLISNDRNGKVVDLSECFIAASWMAAMLKVVRQWWEECGLSAYHFLKNTGSLRTLTLKEGKRTGEKMVVLTVSGHHDHFLTRLQLNSLTKSVVAALPGENPTIFLRIHRVKKGSPSSFYEMHLSGPDALREEISSFGRTFCFHISPSSFFQPNPVQAEKLFRRAFEMGAVSKNDRVYDLYCGGGVAGILLSPHVKRVIGIESNPYAVCDAKRNIEANQVDNLSVIRAEVSQALLELKIRPDLVLVDPPRTGIDQAALSHLIKLGAPKIIYISCQPVTQKENISALIDGGYRLREIQPVDQFPHTPHIESIAYLTHN